MSKSFQVNEQVLVEGSPGQNGVGQIVQITFDPNTGQAVDCTIKFAVGPKDKNVPIKYISPHSFENVGRRKTVTRVLMNLKRGGEEEEGPVAVATVRRAALKDVGNNQQQPRKMVAKKRVIATPRAEDATTSKEENESNKQQAVASPSPSLIPEPVIASSSPSLALQQNAVVCSDAVVDAFKIKLLALMKNEDAVELSSALALHDQLAPHLLQRLANEGLIFISEGIIYHV